MSVIASNPVTGIHYLLAQPSTPPAPAAPQTPAPAAASGADKDGDSDKGGVDIKA